MGVLARFAIDNSRLTVLLIAFVVFGGVVIYLTQPSREDPAITSRTAVVAALFPGLAPARVEELLTKPLEESIKEMPEVDKITSLARTGYTQIKVTVHDRYFDIAPIWTDLRNRMSDIRGELPDGTIGPFVNDDFGDVSQITLALHGDGFTMAELRRVARDVRDGLAALPLVARVGLYGIQEERIWLDADPDLLAQVGMTTAQLVAEIRAQNVILPGGTLDADGIALTIEPSGNFESVGELRAVAANATNGEGFVYLQDLMRIRRDYVDPPDAPVFFNGRPAIVLGIQMVDASSISLFADEVMSAVRLVRERLPLGLSLDVMTYQPSLVDQSIRDASNNLLQTLAIVLVVVVFFLGVRTGLIVGSIVPLTVLLTLVVMRLWEVELHRVSIAAVIIALGLLVDNGIVMAEDIRRRMLDGVSGRNAATGAVSNLGLPLLSSSLTTILAFIPLMLAENAAGEYLRSLAQVVIAALIGSWFLSVTVTPALCCWFLAKKPDAADDEPRAEGRYYSAYRRMLEMTLGARPLFVALMVGVLGLAVWSFQFVPRQFMSTSERAQFLVYLELPAGAHVTKTIDATTRLARWLSDAGMNPEVTRNVAYVTGGGPRFFLTLSPPDAAPHRSYFVVNTQGFDDVAIVRERVEAFIKQEIPEARGRTELLFLGPTPIGTVELRLVGPDAATLVGITRDVEAIFRSHEGATAIRNDWDNPVVKVRVDVDQDRARRAGITSEDIAVTLAAYFDGIEVTDYREGDKVIPVMLRSEQAARTSLDRLRTLTVRSMKSGAAIPLLQVADFRGAVEPSEIRRYNQERTVTIFGRHRDWQAATFLAAMAPQLEALDLPPGYRLDVGGEVESSSKASDALFDYMPLALTLIVILLVWQFNSFRRPLIIAGTIPLILIGAVAGLLVTGAFFSFTALLGLFSLAGIIINNGIVMIERVDEERASSDGVDAAVINAAVARARPIIMTTLTTILGLVPLALFGGAFWFPMAVVIMAGLMVGTVLTLFFVPVLYSLLFRGFRAN